MRMIGILAGLGLALAPALATAADDSKTVDCSDTALKFEAPGYEVTCKDFSRSSVSVDSMAIGVKIVSLHAVSTGEQTFLDVVDDHILGSSHVFYHRRSMESDITARYDARFADWADEEEEDGFEVKRVTVRFKSDDPVDCLAFRKLGARRYEGVGGVTVGLTCSYGGREQAHETLKKFLAER